MHGCDAPPLCWLHMHTCPSGLCCPTQRACTICLLRGAEWMLWLRTHVGFDGWRLDFVKVGTGGVGWHSSCSGGLPGQLSCPRSTLPSSLHVCQTVRSARLLTPCHTPAWAAGLPRLARQGLHGGIHPAVCSG